MKRIYRRIYYDSVIVREDGPFSMGMIRAEGALCPDGKRRNAHPSSDGIADTFFSIPTFVYAKGKRVYGYVTVETYNGSSIARFADPTTVKFVPYRYRKHHALVEAS